MCCALLLLCAPGQLQLTRSKRPWRAARLPHAGRRPAAALPASALQPACCRLLEEWAARLKDLALISKLAVQLWTYLAGGARRRLGSCRAAQGPSEPAALEPPR